MHSFRDVFEYVRLRRRRLWLWGNNSCRANSPSPNIHRCHRVSHCMAVGVGWGDPVHRFGSILCGLGLGTLSFGRLLIHFRPLGLVSCSFSVQLDIQSTVANAIIAA